MSGEQTAPPWLVDRAQEQPRASVNKELQTPLWYLVRTHADANGSLQLINRRFPIPTGAVVVFDLGEAVDSSDTQYRAAGWLFALASVVHVVGGSIPLNQHFVSSLRWYGLDARPESPQLMALAGIVSEAAITPDVTLEDEELSVLEVAPGDCALVDLTRARSISADQCAAIASAVRHACRVDIARGSWEIRTAVVTYLSDRGITLVAHDPRRTLGEVPLSLQVTQDEQVGDGGPAGAKRTAQGVLDGVA